MLTILSVCGDVLVIQPAFLFASVSNNSINTTTVAEMLIEETGTVPHDSDYLLGLETVPYDNDYLLGVVLCQVAAATISAANIVQIKITDERAESSLQVDRNHLMISSGVWNILLSVSSLPLLPNTLLTSPLTMSPVTVAMLLVSGVVTLVAVWMMVTAVSLTQHPTLVR